MLKTIVCKTLTLHTVSSESVEGESIGTCEEVVTSTQSCFQGSSKTEKCCKQVCPGRLYFYPTIVFEFSKKKY